MPGSHRESPSKVGTQKKGRQKERCRKERRGREQGRGKERGHRREEWRNKGKGGGGNRHKFKTQQTPSWFKIRRRVVGYGAGGAGFHGGGEIGSS